MSAWFQNFYSKFSRPILGLFQGQPVGLTERAFTESYIYTVRDRDRQTDRQTDRDRDRQTDRQTDRDRDREKQRQTDRIQCCLTSTETIILLRTITDGEPRTATSTFTQLLIACALTGARRIIYAQ